jgi:hypothetical protein
MAKGWALVLLFSAFCGALVGTGFGMALGYTFFVSFLASAAAGLVIGIAGRMLSELVYRRIGTSPIASFAVVFAVIGIGTVACSLLFGVRDALWISLMAAAAEIIGLAFSFAVYRYTLRLNMKLRETQAALPGDED